MAHTRLTAIKVANAKSDPRKRVEVPDAGKPGLYLVIQPNGRKSWAVRYRRLSDRKPRKLTLDGFPSLATAHKLAQAALDTVAEGGDPAAEKLEIRRAARTQTSDSIEDAIRLFLDKHVRTRGGRPIRETTRRETARLLGFKRDPKTPSQWVTSGAGVLARWQGPRWQGRTAQTVRTVEVRDLIEDLAETAPIVANRTLSALKLFFGWLVKRDREALPVSPCDGVEDPAPETARERELSDAELAALWRAADVDGNPFGRMVQILILTGCRRDEVREVTERELDIGKRDWLIPGWRTKNGLEHLVPVTDAMAALLKVMPRIKGNAGLLFTTTGETPISGLAKYKKRLTALMAKNVGSEPER
jgi:integrase